MPDVYANIHAADTATLEYLSEVLEDRASNLKQRSILENYLSEIAFPDRARVLEVGCGTGAVSRILAGWPTIKEVTGIDPSPAFLIKASELAKRMQNLFFQVADGAFLPFSDNSFDAVIFHTTMCHVKRPKEVLREAYRVLRMAGWLSVFDGDYTQTTVTKEKLDPLQRCVDAWIQEWQNDAGLMKRLPEMACTAGFKTKKIKEFNYTESSDASYLLTVIDRGADKLVDLGNIGTELSAALKAEARRRITSGVFYGSIIYIHLIAQKQEQ